MTLYSLCSTPSEERTTLNDIEAQQKLDSTVRFTINCLQKDILIRRMYIERNEEAISGRPFYGQTCTL